jgi:uncharacterized protein (DUF983 family)
MVWRAGRRRCPNCGGRGIFEGWYLMAARCPRCGLMLERNEEGYFLGALSLNLVVAELTFAAVFVAILVLTWPTPPWQWLTYGSPMLVIGLPALFYPFSKTLFLGVDLLFRPDEGENTSDADQGGTGSR